MSTQCSTFGTTPKHVASYGHVETPDKFALMFWSDALSRDGTCHFDAHLLKATCCHKGLWTARSWSSSQCGADTSESADALSHEQQPSTALQRQVFLESLVTVVSPRPGEQVSNRTMRTTQVRPTVLGTSADRRSTATTTVDKSGTTSVTSLIVKKKPFHFFCQSSVCHGSSLGFEVIHELRRLAVHRPASEGSPQLMTVCVTSSSA